MYVHNVYEFNISDKLTTRGMTTSVFLLYRSCRDSANILSYVKFSINFRLHKEYSFSTRKLYTVCDLHSC